MIAAPQIRGQDFKILTVIGSGGFASVHTAYLKITQLIFAIKKFDEGSTEEMIINEVWSM